jgi:hypothetical protein
VVLLLDSSKKKKESEEDGVGDGVNGKQAVSVSVYLHVITWRERLVTENAS